MLAGRGVHPLQIQSLGRWKSPLVLHYAGDAMSTGIAANLQRANAAPATAYQAAQARFLESLEQRLASLETQEPRPPAATAPAAAPAQQQLAQHPETVVKNTESGAFHKTIGGGPRCYCGWVPSKRGKYRTVPDVPAETPYTSICAYCLPEERDVARMVQLGEEPSEIE